MFPVAVWRNGARSNRRTSRAHTHNTCVPCAFTVLDRILQYLTARTGWLADACTGATRAGSLQSDLRAQVEAGGGAEMHTAGDLVPRHGHSVGVVTEYTTPLARQKKSKSNDRTQPYPWHPRRRYR